jgi:hypothetical protein
MPEFGCSPLLVSRVAPLLQRGFTTNTEEIQGKTSRACRANPLGRQTSVRENDRIVVRFGTVISALDLLCSTILFMQAHAPALFGEVSQPCSRYA